ncbi:TVP38/TMEM64 family protein [Prochlorococcus marinus]|uniref:Putative DedA family protein n=1 Tax=Prochlorococcus marinus str. GP2 TaxID=59925 RepID=A0A0A1ZC75_PROMR|nr:VTT domain-containing protein [Prochlorococcus marinus]KGF85744.1 putative DedA family protein [Prochlorococcus marinus str. GP2]
MNIVLENIYNLSFFNTGIGILSFVCIYILIVLLILPASWLSLLSGFLYGSYLGSIIVFISASIGASAAFFLSKTFFAKKLKNLFSRYPKLSIMEKIVEKGGFKLIFLARLSPIFPFSILNYFYGLNNIKFRDFFLGLLGIIPGTFLYCSIGSLAKSLQELKNVQSPNNLYMTLIGVVSTSLVVYFLAKYSKEYFENS